MNRSFLSLLAFFLLSVTLTNCSLFQHDIEDELSGKTDTYAGLYTQGIEDSWFRPCLRTDEDWKLSEIRDTSFYSRIPQAGSNPAYVEFSGTPSRKGNYKGFFASYDREFILDEIITVESTDQSSCTQL